MSRFLVIGPDERATIQALIHLAAQAPVDMQTLMAEIKTPLGKAAHMQRMTKQSIDIPHGFVATFSFETGHPLGPCRHLSVSIDDPAKLPSIEAVRMIMAEFGFVRPLEQCVVWTEHLIQGHAINVVEPTDQDVDLEA